MYSIIVATAKNGVIGKTGGIPWYLPADLAHFKQITMGHPIIMGRVTHDSIGKALSGRRNIVITRQPNYPAVGCSVAGSLEAALNIVKDDPEVFIIGGQEIYYQALTFTERIYLTEVDAQIDGDKVFRYNKDEWSVISRHKHQKDEANHYDYSFVVLERNLVVE